MNGGRVTVPEYKKILIALPLELVEGVDEASSAEGISRSEFIRRALGECLKEQQRKKLREKLKNGYIEVGDINLSLAELYFEADNDTQMYYEEKLSECETE